MMYVTFFLMISLIVYGLLTIKAEKSKLVEKRLSILKNEQQEQGVLETAKEKKERKFYERILLPLWKEFKRSFKRKMPGEKEAKLEIKLLQAGNPFGMTSVEYRLIQISLFILLPFLFGSYGVLLNSNLAVVFLFGLVGVLIAIGLPRYYINLKIKKRNQLALRELPDVLDLLTVSLEAGLGFDSALSKLVSKKDGILPSEFHRCLEEIRLGKTRREALSGIRERLVIDEVRALISSILQAEKLGIGMVQVLRVQSNEVRDRRKQRAEEEAMKAPIKMLFPLVLFIFPSIFIVLLGPAVIQFMDAFK
ncbi:type II secretion system F family protein [Bacillus luteolus]|uniref:Type II secretion system F family protein n=1 Tax=Litchfieldia luteola TaxID=682179 RepID=A0ABR9QLL1_9BACI|nr:type II secretion system F family protein [Cytobacillus luteolus]MBE4909301.1 type II secretion system F family protein [Cytobacillus luteolus]MBP1940695.1 tight adherence protein C [Cytobacillus luteolus]